MRRTHATECFDKLEWEAEETNVLVFGGSFVRLLTHEVG